MTIPSPKAEPVWKELEVILKQDDGVAVLTYRNGEHDFHVEPLGPYENLKALLEAAIGSIRHRKPKSVFVVREDVRYRITNTIVRELLDGTLTAADLAD